MPYISLDNKVEPQFLLLSLQRESKYWIKKDFDKTIAAKVHGSNFVIFNFRENDVFLELCRIFRFFKNHTLMISATLKGHWMYRNSVVMFGWKILIQKRVIFNKILFLYKVFHGDFWKKTFSFHQETSSLIGYQTNHRTKMFMPY